MKYRQYKPGMALAGFFEDDAVPMMQMLHLRQLDFPISRGVSYERTVDEFLKQLVVNDVLRPLRDRKDMVILLDAQGALVEKSGQWSLLFMPGCPEQHTLEEDCDMQAVYRDLLRKEKKGEVCRIAVPRRSQKALISGTSPFNILDEYCQHQNQGYLSVAERIVYAGPQELFAHVPFCHYGALTTVDKDEVENYSAIKSLLDDYIFQFDHVEDDDFPRPLSIAVFGAPGSGKSFGLRQLAMSCGRFNIISLNLSQYASPQDLFESFREAFQYEGGKIPLIFFDEFDSELNGVPRDWLKYFLAPMQDGEYMMNGRVCPIHGAVFVFAGATASCFNDFLPSSEEEEAQFRKVKGTDFVSRLKGILNVKGPNPMSVTDRSHIIRRAMLLRSQIIRKVPSIYDEKGGLINMSRSLLAVLLTVSEYRHGARSLEFILDMSRLSKVHRFTPSCLPVDEQLDLHLDVEDFQRRLAFEQMAGDLVEKYAQIAHENACSRRIEAARRRGGSEQQIESLLQEPDMAQWPQLDEFYREGYYSQFRYIGVRLQDYNLDIGMRPVLEGGRDTIVELYGPVLEELARIEHERWMKDKLSSGWQYGPFNGELKTTPELVPYEKLDETVKDEIRLSVRDLPANLRGIGYELYRKAL